MAEAEKKEFSDYASFNEFFIRSLADSEILIKNPTALCLPADGKISQIGKLMISYYCKLKGHYFELADLLAEDKELVDLLKNGDFVITYLSPRDYHRVHMPCDGILRKMIYVPGSLFSVNPF